MNIEERIDDLQNGYKIIQNRNGFCFGIDSVLLADFSKEIKNNSKVIDLGTGTGILPILLCAKTNAKKIVGIEIQEEVAEMARRSVLLNLLQDRIEIKNEDINNLDKIYNHKEFDYVITNPPYKKIGTGEKSNQKKELISRHEIKANFEDFVKATKYLLKDNGTMFCIHRPERITEIITTLKKYKLEPKEMKFVYPKKGKNANLVLIKSIKNAKEFLIVKESLYVYDENMKYTKEILKIYENS